MSSVHDYMTGSQWRSHGVVSVRCCVCVCECRRHCSG